MSTDDIVFDEIRYREPSRERRPDHDPGRACLAYGTPDDDDLLVFVDYRTADYLERHALRDTSVELGGILLGRECVDDRTGRPFVRITEAIEARHFENTQASFTYTHDSWEEITRERDRHHPDLDIVGWYHTHPDFGIFLSGHDQFLHRHFFAQPLQVAYVIDPIRQARGCFHVRDGTFAQVGGFVLTSDRGDRLALARFVNDLEGIPNAGGGGGGLSPLLEAQLMAMLARPNSSTAASTGQTAALFTLMGLIAGALSLAALLWLNTLSQGQREQTRAIEALRAGMEEPGPAAAIEKDLARVQGKEAALDALLHEVRAGAEPGRFPALFAEVRLERDRARADLEAQRIATHAVAEVNARLQAELKALRAEAARLAGEAEQVARLREQVATLDAQLEDREPAEISDRDHRIARYAALAGWSAAILLLLGLLVALFRPGRSTVDEGNPPLQIPS